MTDTPEQRLADTLNHLTDDLHQTAALHGLHLTAIQAGCLIAPERGPHPHPDRAAAALLLVPHDFDAEAMRAGLAAFAHAAAAAHAHRIDRQVQAASGSIAEGAAQLLDPRTDPTEP